MKNADSVKAEKPQISRPQLANSLLSVADRVAAEGIASMSMEEISAEVKAARAERKKRVTVMTLDDLKAEAAKGRRKDFDDFLAKVPGAPASPTLNQLLLSDVGRAESLTPPRKRSTGPAQRRAAPFLEALETRSRNSRK